MKKGFGAGAVIVIVALILIIGGYMYYSRQNTDTSDVTPVDTAATTETGAGEGTLVTPLVTTDAPVTATTTQ